VIEYSAANGPFAHDDDSATALERDYGNGYTDGGLFPPVAAV